MVSSFVPKKIVKAPSPILREVIPFGQVHKDDYELFVPLLAVMHKAAGIGLAAPQVGLRKRFALIEVIGDKEHHTPTIKPMILIDPKIIKFSKEESTMIEGCLSIPGVEGEVTRPDWVVVEYRDELGEKKRKKVSGLLARIVQHEIDHLDGMLFTDKANPKTIRRAK